MPAEKVWEGHCGSLLPCDVKCVSWTLYTVCIVQVCEHVCAHLYVWLLCVQLVLELKCMWCIVYIDGTEVWMEYSAQV